jgi:hypothetical protein
MLAKSCRKVASVGLVAEAYRQETRPLRSIRNFPKFRPTSPGKPFSGAVVIDGAEALNLGRTAGLLRSELIAGKADHGEVLAAQRGEQIGATVERLNFEIVERVHLGPSSGVVALFQMHQ